MAGDRDAVETPEQQHKLQATGTAVLQQQDHTVSLSPQNPEDHSITRARQQ